MPFTPYHFGPGLMTKSIFGKNFSIIAFAISQVLIDLESLYYLLKHASHVHRLLHTYLGATLIVFCTVILTKLILKMLNMPTNWFAIIFASIFGAYSHILLDSIMHADIRPFYPILESNHLLRIIEIPLLHELCVYSGMLGLILIIIKSMFIGVVARHST